MSDSAALPDSLAAARGLHIQPECQPLNSVDRMLGLVDHSLRRLGSPGFETQTLVWLSRCVDMKRLRAALGLLGQLYPAIAGRLVRSQHGVGPYWQFHPSAGCSLEETHLDCDDRQAVLDHAARLLATSADPSEVAPMRFYLLHRPGGKDVLLVQYNHTLLDHGAAQNLLCAINLLDESVTPQFAPVRKVWRDPIWRFLQGHNRKHRLRVARELVPAWEQIVRKGALQVNRAAQRSGAALGILARRLDARTTAAVQASIVQTCGIPSWSMAVLASAFRVLNRLAPDQKSTTLVAGIGADLGMSGVTRPAVGNWTSLLPIGAQRSETHDRDALRRSLSSQFRARLASGADIGVLELTMVFSRRQRQALWVIENFLRYGFSLWYAYFGSLDALGETFCGTAVEEMFSVGPCWAPMGLTLLVNQFQGSLQLQTTYVPEAVPLDTATQFLEGVVDDLTSDVSTSPPD